jgi:hypothetical protein
MIVRLRSRQLDAVRRAVSYERPFMYWLTQGQLVYRLYSTYDVPMPALGWKRVLGHLENMTVGPMGGNKAGVRSSAITARNKVAKQLTLLEIHPALRGERIAGHSNLVIPAWDANPVGRERRWSIYPDDGEFVLLVPYHDTHGRVPVTLWKPVTPQSPMGLTSELEHLVFEVPASRSTEDGG